MLSIDHPHLIFNKLRADGVQKWCVMLSIDHPHLIGHLRLFRYGLMPVIGVDGEHLLIVKATKEGILAVRRKAGFKVYLLSEASEHYLGLVTAFFDDHDEPLTLRTALFHEDELTRDIDTVLSQREFNVYFFDELDRELMGVRVADPGAGRFHETMARASFEVASGSPSATWPTTRAP